MVIAKEILSQTGGWMMPSNALRGIKMLGAGGLVSRLLEASYWIAGVLTVIYIIQGSYHYIMSGGGDVKQAKETIKNAIIGFVFVMLALAIKLAVDQIVS